MTDSHVRLLHRQQVVLMLARTRHLVLRVELGQEFDEEGPLHGRRFLQYLYVFHDALAGSVSFCIRNEKFAIEVFLS